MHDFQIQKCSYKTCVSKFKETEKYSLKLSFAQTTIGHLLYVPTTKYICCISSWGVTHVNFTNLNRNGFLQDVTRWCGSHETCTQSSYWLLIGRITMHSIDSSSWSCFRRTFYNDKGYKNLTLHLVVGESCIFKSHTKGTVRFLEQFSLVLLFFPQY